MRTLSMFLLLCLIRGVVVGQSSNLDPPSGTQSQAGWAATTHSAKPSVETVLATAQEKLEHGDPQEATAMLEKLAATDGASSKGLQHALGIAYYRTGKLVSAEQAFARAIDQDPNDVESVQMRGLSLYRLGRPAAAIPYLERVKQWMPNSNADASYVLGLCYLNSNRFDDARLAFANQFAVPSNSGSGLSFVSQNADGSQFA
jgi:tetratricopeptide (TPR) repeat protein